MLVENQYVKAGTHHPSFSISIRQCLTTQKKKVWNTKPSPDSVPKEGGFEKKREGEVAPRRTKPKIGDIL